MADLGLRIFLCSWNRALPSTGIDDTKDSGEFKFIYLRRFVGYLLNLDFKQPLVFPDPIVIENKSYI